MKDYIVAMLAPILIFAAVCGLVWIMNETVGKDIEPVYIEQTKEG